MKFKPLMRIAAIDDGVFFPRKSKNSLLAGVVSRLDNRVEGIISCTVKVDGTDAGKKILEMVKKSKFDRQIKAVLLHGINFAGFNIVDVEKLSEGLQRPVIVCFKKKPDLKKIRKALQKLPQSKKRIKLIESAPKIRKFRSMRFQCAGCQKEEAGKIIKKTLLYSSLPEPLRLAHLIASGVTSKGR